MARRETNDKQKDSKGPRSELWNMVRIKMTSWWGTLKVLAEYILNDNSRNKRSFFIGLATVFLVVMFLTLLQNALNRTGLIFLKLAEDSIGSFDVLLLPDIAGTSAIPLLNYTLINSTLANSPSLSGAAARWIGLANVTAVSTNTSSAVTIVVIDSDYENYIGLARGWPYRALGDGEAHVSAPLLRVLGIRPNHGEAIRIEFDLARGFASPNGETNGLMPGGQSGNSSVFPANGGPGFIDFNQTIEVPLPIFNSLPDPTRSIVASFLNLTNSSSTVSVRISDLFNLSAIGPFVLSRDVIVADAIEQSFGKFPSSLGNVIVLEKSFAQTLINDPFSNISPVLKGVFTFDFDIDEYAMSVVVNLNDRSRIYTETNEKRTLTMIDKTNEVMKRLGINFSTMVIVPLSEALNAIQFLRIFVDELFFTVTCVLVLLSVILVTSLLLSDTEEKTFEFGILRSLGLKSGHLVLLLTLQAMLFAIPGILLGLLLCYLAFIPIGYIISTYSATPMDFTIDTGSVLLGFFLGLFLPVIGVIVPIRRALGKTIRDALDVYHNTTFDTVIKIQELEKLGLSPTTTIISILMVVVGFLVYYMIPLSFALNRLDIFFRIFTCILLGMFIGLVLISDALQSVIGQGFATIMTFCTGDRFLTHVVLKNLAGHVSRNRKTSLMFTLCVGYIVLAAAMFDLQINSLSENLSAAFGSDIIVTAPNLDLFIPEDKLRIFLATKTDLVEDFTFVTFPLRSYFPVQGSQVQRIAGLTGARSQVYGVESNYLNVAMQKYYVVDEFSPSISFNYTRGQRDAVQALFSYYEPYSVPFEFDIRSNAMIYDSGFNTTAAMLQEDPLQPPNITIPVIMPASYKSSAQLVINDNITFSVGFSAKLKTSVDKFLAKPVAFMKKLSGFPGINRFVSQNAPILISIENYNLLYGYVQRCNNETTIRTARYEKVLIRMKDFVSKRDLESFAFQLTNVLENDKFVVTNLQSQIASTVEAADFLMILFYIVALIGIIFSFFVLFLSFTANIRENAWELGVLRAIGMTNFAVTRLYIYEALSVIFSSILLGTVLGIFTAITVTLQNLLFSEMAFEFNFPGVLFVIIIFASISLGILGSYLPIREYSQKPIAIILRG